jgi:hypothetical protein
LNFEHDTASEGDGMKKRHALGLSALVSLAVVAAAFATVRSVQARGDEGPAPIPAASSASQPSELDRYEARLDAALATARAKAADISAPAGGAVEQRMQLSAAASDDTYERERDDHGGDGFESEQEDD